MTSIQCALAFTIGTLFTSVSASASNVGIVDSGTFFGHESIASQSWTNPNEIVGNLVDDDNNGLVDDIVGWNFADNLPKVFNEEYMGQFDEKVYRAFAVIASIQAKQLTEANKTWFKTNVQDLPKSEKDAFFAKLNFFGQYAHGTHCSGVVALGNPQSKIMSARIFPDQLPPTAIDAATEGFGYELLATATNKQFFQVASYLNSQKMDVANFSIGVPMEVVARKLMALTGKKNPTDAQVQKEAQNAATAFVKQGQKWISSTPNTLFVIAAANDGRSNALYPVFPAMVQAENAITVAATNGWASLAEFSNWDPATVHVAAPGVAIRSTVPGVGGKLFLRMSGTSMAAPFVTMLASTIKDINPLLNPADLKAILIGTVDKKAWLAAKVASEGVVNTTRAERAADLSKTMSIADAVSQARSEIADTPELPVVIEENILESGANANVLPSREMSAWAHKLAQ
jgi:subtilisin family serine protease